MHLDLLWPSGRGQPEEAAARPSRYGRAYRGARYFTGAADRSYHDLPAPAASARATSRLGLSRHRCGETLPRAVVGSLLGERRERLGGRPCGGFRGHPARERRPLAARSLRHRHGSNQRTTNERIFARQIPRSETQFGPHSDHVDAGSPRLGRCCGCDLRFGRPVPRVVHAEQAPSRLETPTAFRTRQAPVGVGDHVVRLVDDPLAMMRQPRPVASTKVGAAARFPKASQVAAHRSDPPHRAP